MSCYAEDDNMLDRLSVDCVELLDELESKSNEIQVEIIKKYVHKISNKYESIPEFAEGEHLN